MDVLVEWLRLTFGFLKDFFVYCVVLRINILTTKCLKINNWYMRKCLTRCSTKKFLRILSRSFKLIAIHRKREVVLNNLQFKINKWIDKMDHMMYVYTGRHFN